MTSEGAPATPSASSPSSTCPPTKCCSGPLRLSSTARPSGLGTRPPRLRTRYTAPPPPTAATHRRCDVHASSDPDGLGIFDLRLYDYEGVLRVPLARNRRAPRAPPPRQPPPPSPPPRTSHPSAPSLPPGGAPRRHPVGVTTQCSSSAPTRSEFDNYFGGDEVDSGFDGSPDEGGVVDGTRVTRLRFENSWGGIGDWATTRCLPRGSSTCTTSPSTRDFCRARSRCSRRRAARAAAVGPDGRRRHSAFGSHQHDDTAPAAKEKEDAPNTRCRQHLADRQA